MAKARTSLKLLNAVTSVGASAPVETQRQTFFTVIIEASVVTTGGTIKIQSLAPTGTWVDISTSTINANGNTVVTVTGAHEYLRANLTARTDGTYTVSMMSSD